VQVLFLAVKSMGRGISRAEVAAMQTVLSLSMCAGGGQIGSRRPSRGGRAAG